MIDKNTLTETLEQFSGTEEWYRWSGLYPKFVLTDGAKYLAENAGAYWLMDVIGSYQKKLLRKGEYFQVWTLKVMPDRTAVAACTDGDTNRLVRQKIPYTDFPLDEIKLYAAWDETNLVICLPGEY